MTACAELLAPAGGVAEPPPVVNPPWRAAAWVFTVQPTPLLPAKVLMRRCCHRVQVLLDPGTFVESGSLVQHRCTDFDMDKQHYYGKGQSSTAVARGRAALLRGKAALVKCEGQSSSTAVGAERRYQGTEQHYMVSGRAARVQYGNLNSSTEALMSPDCAGGSVCLPGAEPPLQSWAACNMCSGARPRWMRAWVLHKLGVNCAW